MLEFYQGLPVSFNDFPGTWFRGSPLKFCPDNWLQPKYLVGKINSGRNPVKVPKKELIMSDYGLTGIGMQKMYSGSGSVWTNQVYGSDS